MESKVFKAFTSTWLPSTQIAQGIAAQVQAPQMTLSLHASTTALLPSTQIAQGIAAQALLSQFLDGHC